jgi:hypothetical protein
MSPLAIYSVRHSSQDVTMEELKNFLGVLINMDLNDKAEMTVIFFESWVDRMLFCKDVFG